MEDILKLRDRYMKDDFMELENLLKSQRIAIDETQKTQQHRLNEGELKLEEHNSQLPVLTKDLKHGTAILTKLSNEALELDESLVINISLLPLLQNTKTLKNQLEQAVLNNHELESQKIKLNSKLWNPKDQKLLEMGRKKFALYKEFTKIHWDYSAPEDTCKGYVSNATDYVKGFKYTTQTNDEELSNNLWDEISLSTKNVENHEKK